MSDVGNQSHCTESLQQRLLECLHENHPGITHMKAIARSYVWWELGILEKMVVDKCLASEQDSLIKHHFIAISTSCVWFLHMPN